jgi:hypothetical protein
VTHALPWLRSFLLSLSPMTPLLAQEFPQTLWIISLLQTCNFGRGLRQENHKRQSQFNLCSTPALHRAPDLCNAQDAQPTPSPMQCNPSFCCHFSILKTGAPENLAT